MPFSKFQIKSKVYDTNHHSYELLLFCMTINLTDYYLIGELIRLEIFSSRSIIYFFFLFGSYVIYVSHKEQTK